MKEMFLPPSRVCEICKLRMSQPCVEKCAPSKNYVYFDPNMDKPIELFPRLTMKEYRDLNGRMKGEWLFVIYTRILEELNGQNYDNPPSRRILTNIKVKNLLPGAEKENPALEDRKECTSEGERLAEVA